jgi:hypothetical protein
MAEEDKRHVARTLKQEFDEKQARLRNVGNFRKKTRYQQLQPKPAWMPL